MNRYDYILGSVGVLLLVMATLFQFSYTGAIATAVLNLGIVGYALFVGHPLSS